MARSRLIAAMAAGALLGGCGGASNASHTVSVPDATVPAGSGRPTTTAAATPTGTASTPTTTTTAATGGACTAAELKPAFLGQNGAAGHVALGFALRNDGAAACHTYGFPGVQLLDRAGTAVGSPAQRTTRDLIGAATEHGITLGPGQEASFRIIVSEVGSGPAACPTADAVQVIAPDDTARMAVAVTPVQSCGAPTVTPLQPGATGYPLG
jgi:hypothetical protein